MKQITWTDQKDDLIRTMRGEGFGWGPIGDALGVSKPCARFRGIDLGLSGTAQPQTCGGFHPAHDRAGGGVSDGIDTAERSPAQPILPSAPSAYARALRHGRPERHDCLPAGHPYSWSILTAGTCMEGVAFDAP